MNLEWKNMKDSLIYLHSKEDLEAKVSNQRRRGGTSRKPPFDALGLSLSLASSPCLQVDIMAVSRQFTGSSVWPVPKRLVALKFPSRHRGLRWNQTWSLPGVFVQILQPPLISNWFSYFSIRPTNVNQPNLCVLEGCERMETIDASVRRNSWMLLNWMLSYELPSKNEGFLSDAHHW